MVRLNFFRLPDDQGTKQTVRPVGVGERVVEMSTGGGSSELVLESRVARNGTLRNHGTAVHKWGFVVRLSSPVDVQGVAWNFIDYINDQYIILTHLYGRAWQLSVCCDDTSGVAVGGGTQLVVAI